MNHQVLVGGGTIDIGGFASGGAGGSPLAVSATAVGSDLIDGGGLGEVIWYFEWLGPSGQVPTDVDVLLQTGIAGNFGLDSTNVFAEADFSVVNVGVIHQSFETTADCFFQGFSSSSCDNHQFQGTVHLPLFANVVYQATLDARASAGVIGPIGPTADGQSANAFADPYIYLDPSFTNAGAYRLVLSDGIANVPVAGPPPSVPEPATMTLLALGLAGLGFSRRRNRKLQH